MLVSASGAQFKFMGVPELLKRAVAPESSLQPPDAIGAGLSRTQGLHRFYLGCIQALRSGNLRQLVYLRSFGPFCWWGRRAIWG